MRVLLLALAALALAGCHFFGSATPPKANLPLMLPPSSEWFPSLVPPSSIAGQDRADLLHALNVAKVEVLWIQYIDLDSDRCNDAIVTFALPPEKAGEVTTWTTLTVIFHGRHEGAFVQPFAAGDIWFGLITGVATAQSAGDTETRRQFSVRRAPEAGGGLILTLHDCTYANDANAVEGRFFQFRGSTTSTVRVNDLPQDRPLGLDVPPLAIPATIDPAATEPATTEPTTTEPTTQPAATSP